MTDPIGNGLPGAPVAARLLANAGVQRVPSPKFDLFIAKATVPAALCALLIERIDVVRRPSTVADSNGDAAYRTSVTGDLAPDEPAVIGVERIIADLTGLDGLFVDNPDLMAGVRT